MRRWSEGLWVRLNGVCFGLWFGLATRLDLVTGADGLGGCGCGRGEERRVWWNGMEEKGWRAGVERSNE